MDDNKQVAEEEFEIIEAPAPGEPPKAEVQEPKEEDERLRNVEDEDEDEDNTGREQETPEQRAERRREERRKRKERQRQAEAHNKAELQRMREANEMLITKMQQLEAATLRNEARQVDQRMMDARARHDWAEKQHAEAIARGDGIGASKALRERDIAAAEYREAESLRARLVEYSRESQQKQPAPPEKRGPDPRLVSKAKAFIEKHPWIDPTGQKDEDSAIMRAIDIRLQQEGYDPTTDEYWETFEKRAEKRLPHRFQKPGRQSPPVSGGMDRASSGKRQFFLSPERKKAIQDAGMWDDPVQRQKMIKRYADYDAQQKSTAAR